jgi:hypothetical protein
MCTHAHARGHAQALPLGDVRDPIDIPNDGGEVFINHITGGVANQFDLILVGVAIMSVLVLCCVLCLHFRLRQEHFALEKEKLSGGSLHRLWVSSYIYTSIKRLSA